MADKNVQDAADVTAQLKADITKLRKDVIAKDDEIALLKKQISELKSSKQALAEEEDKNKETYQCVVKCFYENVLYRKGDLVRFTKGTIVPEWFKKI